jgi:hypothetical protein
MELIERKVSVMLSHLPDQELLRDPSSHQLARLTVLTAIVNSKRIKPAELKRAKEFFQRELDEYVANGCFRPGAGTRKGGLADEVVDRYGRILALSCAFELAPSEDTSWRIAKAIRVEAGALCAAYSDWCSYLLHGMKDSISG